MNEIKNLLTNVQIITKKYDEIAKITGENFNIFTVMTMDWDEVYTHSAVIGELLNPNGSHAQGSIFLDLFVKQINEKFNLEIPKFDVLVDERICERTISISNDLDSATGGRIDIIIADSKQIVLIENKPSAVDQKFQLIRYYNYAKKRGKKFYILYLTMEEKVLKDEESHISESGLIITGRNFPFHKEIEYEEYKRQNINNINNHCCLFYPITFKTEIKAWIENCLEKTVSLPIIRETLIQYLNLINKLTNQSTSDKMSKEIRKLINEDNVGEIRAIHRELENMIRETEYKFKQLLEQNLNLDIELGNKEKIKIGFDEDDKDGFFIGIQYHENNHPLNESRKGLLFTENLKKYFSDIKLGNNDYHIAFYNPKPFKKKEYFRDLDFKEIKRMHDDSNYLNEFVHSIVEEAKLFHLKLIQLSKELELLN